MGVEAGYTEDDVKASSRMLTGYRVDTWWPRVPRLLRPPGPRHRDDQGPRLRAPQHRRRRPGRHEGLPAPPGPPPRHRAAHRPAAVREVRQRQPVGRAGRARRGGVPAQRHQDPAHPARAGRPPRVRRLGRGRRCGCRPRTTSPACARCGWACSRPATSGPSSTRCTGSTSGSGRRPTSGPRPTASRRSARPGPAPVACSTGWATTSTSPPAGGRPRTPHVRRPGAWLPALPATLDTVIDHVGRQLLGQRPSAAVRRGVAMVLELPLSRRMTARRPLGLADPGRSWPPSSTPRPTSTAEGPDMTQTRQPRPCGCPELGSALALSRRRFLAGVAAGTGALTASHAVRRQLPAGLLRRRRRGGNVLVVLSPARRVRRPVDGGAPLRRRPRPAARRCARASRVPEASLLGADPAFGLHPEFAPAAADVADTARSAPCTPSACPPPTAATSTRWPPSRTPTPGPPRGSGGSTARSAWTPPAQPETAVQLGSTLLPTSLAGPAPAIGAREVA